MPFSGNIAIRSGSLTNQLLELLPPCTSALIESQVEASGEVAGSSAVRGLESARLAAFFPLESPPHMDAISSGSYASCVGVAASAVSKTLSLSL